MGAINDLLRCYMNLKKTVETDEFIKYYVEGKTKKKPAWYNCFEFELY